MVDEQKLLDYLKRSGNELKQVRRRLREVESASQEPIAIIAMSCRYPGGVNTPEELWRLVADGVDAISEVPAGRGWELPEPVYGGFLDHPAEFDNAFFGISPRDALAMDPQERLLLEAAWEALERAGIRPGSSAGAEIGVFVGSNGQDYWDLLAHRAEMSGGAGAAAAIISGRLSYTFGWQGPSLSIDTACSSSLVATHLAMQSLRSGESSLALAGGVTVMATPRLFVEFARQNALSPDGRCRAFGDGANGTGWAEGVGVLLLERLSDAHRNGHEVLAVLRGSAVNSDGASHGFSAPNGPSQQRVIRRALANSSLTPADIDLVEAHGTGTVLGDPIEAQALLATYGQERAGGRPLYLGSLKSNIGHTQAAAGVGGIIKVVQAIRHGVLPATLHAGKPSSHVDWSSGAVSLLTGQRPWPGKESPRRAAVSSFGVSGTNAHLIVEQAPASGVPAGEAGETGATTAVPLVLSAKTPAALRESAARLVEVLAVAEPVDVAYSLATTRESFEYRAAVTTKDRGDFVAALRALAGDDEHAGLTRGRAREARTAFLFPGQGAQRAGMGSGLAARYPVFAQAYDQVLDQFGPPLRDAIGDQARLDQTVYTQPAMFAVEVALFRLLESWGVRPRYLAGHSNGEFAVAHVAGILTLPDACRLVAARARLMQALPAGGAMVAVSVGEDEMSSYLDGEGAVAVAAVNGPSAVVVAGDENAVTELAQRFAAKGRRTKRLAVSHAFHSPLMDPMLDEFRTVAESVRYGDASLPIVSTVTGGTVGHDMASADYWVEHVRRTVRFADAVAELARHGADTFVEVGPGGALVAMAREIVPDAVGVATMRSGRGEEAELAAGLAEAHVHGVGIDWDRFFGTARARRVDLPTYPFQHESFWPRVAAVAPAEDEHPLLGTIVELADSAEVLFNGTLSPRRQPWLADHRVGDRIVVPGTALLEMSLCAADHVGLGGVSELILHEPLVLSPKGEVTVQLKVAEPAADGTRRLNVHARSVDSPDEPWAHHASGKLCAAEPDGSGVSWAREWPPDGARHVDLTGAYDPATDGLSYGPAFQGLKAVWQCDGDVFAEVVLPQAERADVDAFAIHPALLDAALHATAYAGLDDVPVPMPFAWSGVSAGARGVFTARARLSRLSSDTVSLELIDPAGEHVLSASSLTLRAATIDHSVRPAVDNALFRLAWMDTDGDHKPEPSDGWLVVDDLSRIPAAVPDVVIVPLRGTRQRSTPEEAHALVARGLGLVSEWLSGERFAKARLVVVTHWAVCPEPGGPPIDLAAASVWGFVRSAQAENPGRFVLVDLDTDAVTADAVAAAVSAGEPQVAVRQGGIRVARLNRIRAGEGLEPPVGDVPWRLEVGNGTLDELVLAPAPGTPLAPGQVRIDVRAVGLNFRDVLTALGMYPGATAGPVGAEAAGVVAEVGPGVTRFVVGQKVMGLFPGGAGQSAVTDHRMLSAFPAPWSFQQAASVPVAYLTAYHGLVDLAALGTGERVLVHAGAGGVGTAAIRLARHLGAEVFATASPAKWPAVRALGVAGDHIASSRSLEFERSFRSLSAGRGIDVVLNALDGAFIDASMRLLSSGGRFVEMGKTDIRRPEDHPRIAYRAFDLFEVGPDRIGEMFATLSELFADGTLAPLPITTWDIRSARDAFRFVSQARHVGKVVLTLPRPLAPQGTVLITGGTGGLGRAVARHLVHRHGVRHLLLASRHGGAEGLAGELAAHGASVRVVACDVSNRDEVAELLRLVPAGHPLTAVVHAAGIVDDGVIGALTGDRLGKVLRPKVAAAWHLHELTSRLDLSAFVLFSSVTGTVGSPGQAGYASANAFLDALAEHRRTLGLPATALAWGPWAADSADGGMIGNLGETDLRRMTRSGVVPMPPANALACFDRAVSGHHPTVVATEFDLSTLRARDDLPPVFDHLVARRAPVAPASVAGGPRAGQTTLDMVRVHAALVLGYASPGAVQPEQTFHEAGFDSLSAVELRNRLERATGVALSATAVFDYPTPAALAAFLDRELAAFHTAAEPETGRETLAVGDPVDDDPVVVVGMACRYPGGVTSPEDLWRLVADGQEGITSFPGNRGWDIAGVHDPDRVRPATTYTDRGGFIDTATDFDAAFFGISPREALGMDPQQRLLLETAWEGFERAGIDPLSLRGSRTGVFAGLIYHDYPALGGFPQAAADYLGTGSAGSVATGRVSYLLGLEGPAVTVDTACSSSLVAIHLAAQSLRAGECELALAGGATVLSTPGAFVEFSRQGVLSVDGRCRSFADDAAGSVWSEGAGVVVLERLSDARRNGHEVLAVLRGSAVNSDGASNGLTAPNGPSQQRVIRQALGFAGLSPVDVDAVEAHGTATELGDPIEAHALIATYGQNREAGRPLWLGSVKSNIGHTQAAAGVAGVIKMVMAMRHQTLPKTLHVTTPSAKVDWAAGAVEVLTERRPWPQPGRPRRAAVSSFGISGTNAHLVLEEPDWSPGPGLRGAGASVPPLLLSAKSPEALNGQAAALLSYLDGHAGAVLADIGYTLHTARSLFAHRAVVLGDDQDELRKSLAAFAAGDPASPVVLGVAESVGPRCVFVFPGQGAQWTGMARELMGSSPAFAARLRECAAALEPYVDWSPLDLLSDGEELDRVEVVQPASWAVMVALAELWRSWDVRPTAVLGHSQGEIAAAVVAGGLSLEDGARVVAARSRLIAEKLAGTGGMASITAPRDVVENLVARCRERVCVAAENGPGSVVVSGAISAIEEFTALGRTAGVDVRKVAVDYASHSPDIEVISEELSSALADVRAAESDILFVSSVTGEIMDTARADGRYWLRNLRDTVRFRQATHVALAAGPTVFIEVSPHPVLMSAIEETITEAGAVARVIGTLRRGDGGKDRFLRSLAEAHVMGVPVDWAPLYAGGRLVPLPTYAFQRERFWPRGAGLPGMSAERRRTTGHALMETVVELPDDGGYVFTALIPAPAQPGGGRVDAVTDVGDFADPAAAPIAALVDLTAHAAETVGAIRVDALTVDRPLTVPEGGIRLQLVVDAEAAGQRRFTVWSRPAGVTGDGNAPWDRYGTGILGSSSDVDTAFGAEVLPGPDAELLDVSLYPGLSALWRDSESLIAETSLPWDADTDGFGLHPHLLAAALAPASTLLAGESMRYPLVWRDVTIHARGADAVRIRLTALDHETVELVVTDLSGAPVASARLSGFREITGDQPTSRPGRLYHLRWDEVSPVGGPRGDAWFTVTRGDFEFGDAIPGVVVLDLRDQTARGTAADVPGAVHAGAEQALGLLRHWVSDARFDTAQLVVVVGGGFTGAAVSGLVRSAQAEHPGRIVLVEDGTRELASATLATALESGEPVLRLREGKVRAARLAGLPAPAPADLNWDREGTVLVTGGTSGIGREVARHLVSVHGMRHLTLVSRRGPAAEGVAELVAELSGQGAEVRIRACDISRREEVTALLADMPAEQPLTAVVHAAGIHRGGVVASLPDDRLHGVLDPKVDGAWHLHELTRELPLRGFVVFSSFSGISGAAGQANYAAANAFLDELVRHRVEQGLPGTALAWGLWTRELGFTSRLDQTDLTRMLRSGVAYLSVERGLALFDAGLGAEKPVVIAMALDRAMVSRDEVPRLLRGVVPSAPRPRNSGGGSAAYLAHRLAPLPTAERERVVLDLVRSVSAAALGHSEGTVIPAESAFRELGVDSLAAVDLRNRLATATGLRLPATVVFDHPNPARLARHVLERMHGAKGEITALRRRPAAPVREPIAIVGMACRFPGGVSSPEDLWRLLVRGEDAITAFPGDRGWNLEHLYDPSRERPGTTYAARGGFLPDAAEFDAQFFGISPREALAMDPQQRLLLETSWEALESAGMDPSSLTGTQTGVFVGGYQQGYATRADDAIDLVRGHLLTGNTSSALSGRISYVLGLEGPAVTVDTACSSSLVATHWATRALRSGECDLAISGGVTVMAHPDVFTEFSRQHNLAEDGRCKPFAAAADGTVLSEGAGILVLERLSDARRNGHEVLAVILGSAVNSDGASNGLSAPNGPSQQRVLRQALDDADLNPPQIDAVEAHGTGTKLGDPIEAQALLATYGSRREAPLLVGALKSNIGHTQAAAGIAGVIKMVLAMRHGLLPKTLHTDSPTAEVDWETGAVTLLTQSTPWPETGRPRRAGVSAFGISGTNAHLVLELPRDVDGGEVSPGPEDGPVPWLVSAATPGALRALAVRLATETDPRASAADIGLALSTTRARLRHRAAIVAADRAAFVEALQALGAGGRVPGLVQGVTGARRLAVQFTGQGAQRVGMGRELHSRFPVFAEALDSVLDHLDTGQFPSPRDVFFAESGTPEAELLHQTGYAQPTIFALEVALYRLVEAWGLRPDFLIGHSLGEIVAAHVSGVFDLPEACRLVAARARLMQELPVAEGGSGLMVAVEAAEADIRPLLGDSDGRVSIAAVNGPTSVVLSGDEETVLDLADRFSRKGVRVKRLTASHAFHSPHMDPMLAAFGDELARLNFRIPAVQVVSTLTGREAADELTSAAYWVRQVRDTVRFADGMTRLAELGVDMVLELGPDPVLSAMAQETAPGLSYTAAMRRGRPETETLLSAVAELFVRGFDLDGEALFSHTATRRTVLPTYPFQRERYWIGTENTSVRTEGAEPAVTDGLWRLEWAEGQRVSVAPTTDTSGWVPAGSALPPGSPDVVLLPVAESPTAGLTPADAARELTARTLAHIRQWLGEDRFLAAKLVFVTRNAVRVAEEVSLAQAAVWGLVRSAQAENPGRFVLVDVDSEISVEAVAGAVATGAPESAVRDGRVLVPRLVPVEERRPLTGPAWDPEGTVLITGGTGGVGHALARHLVVDRGMRHLVLVSRRGGAEELVGELAAHGAGVTVVACDVADRSALARVVDSISPAHPLTAVVHAAGVLDDGVITSLTPERLAGVFDAKVIGAWHLHELTENADLAAFLVFSSAAGLVGAPGQAGYAAANTFLDALVCYRQSLGMPATALAWGPWAGDGMAGRLTEPDRRRAALAGFLPLPAERAMDLFDRAVTADQAVVLPARLDLAAVRALGTARPALFEALVRTGHPHDVVGTTAGNDSDALIRRLAAVSEEDRHHVLTDIIREEVTAVLGFPGTAHVDEQRPFTELGFDSLTAVELRNRVQAMAGIPLPTAVVFDHPTVSRLAGYLLTLLRPGSRAADDRLLERLEEWESDFTAAEHDTRLRARLATKLHAMLARVEQTPSTGEKSLGEGDRAVGSLSDDDLFSLIDEL
ncbi:SDR family NAD(P)-dependent oxidoreductase [Amycolatopsis pigmentata]